MFYFPPLKRTQSGPLCVGYNSPVTKFPISIVKLSPSEWRKYKSIRLEALKMEATAFNSTYEEFKISPSTYWKQKLADNNQIFAFAKSGEKIIGMMYLTIGEENESNKTAVIHGAYVNPDYRGENVGNKLLKFLITEIKKNKNIRLLKLWVKDSQVIAKKLYENMGFEFKNRAGEHTITMEKILSF